MEENLVRITPDEPIEPDTQAAGVAIPVDEPEVVLDAQSAEAASGEQLDATDENADYAGEE